MSERRIKTYYLGSGSISVPVLCGLLRSDLVEVVGIGSQRKALKSARGPVRTMTTPLIKYCEANGIQVDGLASVNNEEFYERFRSSGAEILVVASFGQLLKTTLLELPKYGCLNVHASLLPKYRGAAPVISALLNGDRVTGVTFMEMDAGLDTGGAYRAFELEIKEDDNAASLEERIGELAGLHIGQVIHDIACCGLKPVPQPEEGVSYVKKVNKEDGIVEWNRDAGQIVNMIRAYSPWPSVRARIPSRNGTSRVVKITEATSMELNCKGSRPGDILAFGAQGIIIACGEGALRIQRLIPEGRKEMAACEYLRGAPIPPERSRMCDFISGE